jgi:hypothetical protein
VGGSSPLQSSITACLYFVPPHRLKLVDVAMMAAVSQLVRHTCGGGLDSCLLQCTADAFDVLAYQYGPRLLSLDTQGTCIAAQLLPQVQYHCLR